MPNWPALSRAPIVEALIDISVERAVPIRLEELAGLRDLIGSGYPTMHERGSWVAQIELGPQARLTGQDGGTDGYVFRSADGRYVLQAHLGGMTVSRLHPYLSWDALRQEAERLWPAFVATTQSVRVRRVAVRAINRIPLPLPIQDLSEWVLTGPRLAPSLPQELRDCFVRLVIPMPARRCTVILMQTVERPAEDGSAALILDIDASRSEELEVGDLQLWRALGDLHEVRNEFFFGSLTDRCLEGLR